MTIYDNPLYWDGDIGYRSPGYSDFLINAVKEICIIMCRPKNVLDVGCAYGYTVLRLNSLGIPTWGIDISRLAISRCPQKTDKLTYGTVWDMPYEDKQFDLVYSSGVLEHIPKDKLQQSVDEIVRVSTRGLIGVSCTDDPTTHKEDDTSHIVELTRQEWADLFPSVYCVTSDSTHAWSKLALMTVKGAMYR